MTRTSSSSLPGTGSGSSSRPDDLVAAGPGENHCAHVCSLGWNLGGSLESTPGAAPSGRLPAGVHTLPTQGVTASARCAGRKSTPPPRGRARRCGALAPGARPTSPAWCARNAGSPLWNVFVSAIDATGQQDTGSVETDAGGAYTLHPFQTPSSRSRSATVLRRVCRGSGSYLRATQTAPADGAVLPPLALPAYEFCDDISGHDQSAPIDGAETRVIVRWAAPGTLRASASSRAHSPCLPRRGHRWIRCEARCLRRHLRRHRRAHRADETPGSGR